MIREINETHNTDIIEDLNNRLERRDSELGNGIKIQGVTKSEDLAANVGLQQCINLVLGTSSTRWRYMGYGTGTTAATTADTALTAEVSPRVDMTLFGGWREAVGMKLFFGGILGESVGLSVRETGVFNNPSGATILNHNVFANNPLSRNAFQSVFMFSSVIEFCPVA